MTAPGLAIRATDLAADSNMDMSVAYPAPRPLDLVGVLTLKKTMSAIAMCMVQSIEKNRLGCLAGEVVPSASTLASMPSLATRTISYSPGSWIGRCLDCHRRVRSSFISTTVTLMSGLPYAITAAVGPPDLLSAYPRTCGVVCTGLTDVAAADKAYLAHWRGNNWLSAGKRSRCSIT